MEPINLTAERENTYQSEPPPSDRELLAQAIGILLHANMIRTHMYLRMTPDIVVAVENSVFTDETFDIGMIRQQWDDGPKAAVTQHIVQALREGDLQFKKYDEWGKLISVYPTIPSHAEHEFEHLEETV